MPTHSWRRTLRIRGGVVGHTPYNALGHRNQADGYVLGAGLTVIAAVAPDVAQALPDLLHLIPFISVYIRT